MYVTNLPVTSEVARAGGVEIYGLPKYMARIETTFDQEGVRASLANEFELTHSRSFGIEVDGPPFITYSLLNNALIRTIVEVDHRLRFGGAHTVRLRITGDGPTAATARILGLDVVGRQADVWSAHGQKVRSSTGDFK